MAGRGALLPQLGVSRFVLVGDPESRRVSLFQAALSRLGLAPAALSPWLRLLRGEPLAAPPEGAITRVETPEMGPETYRRLLALGAAEMSDERGERISAAAALALSPDGSGLRYARQHHLGFLRALCRLKAELNGAPSTHAPEEIALLCDKSASAARLAAAGLAVPPELAAGCPRSLREAMASRGVARAFIKLRHGSAAAGAAAFDRSGERERLLTTLAFGEDGPYSSLRLRRYEDPREIDAALGWLFREGARAEEWLPKATLYGREFDLRVVVFSGEARHTIARVSRGGRPMTNLHLGNDRADADAARRRLGARAFREALALAEAAAALFPGSLCLGADVMVVPGRGPVLIELNAFGDLLPGLLWRGQDTYEAQARAALARFGGPRGPDRVR
jgi:glutathione synthase/RimK-type ligase-like ATP-grasp enzyme